MSLRPIKDENSFYVELPKDKIKFVSKEAEMMFDLSLENDYLQQENQELKEDIKGFEQERQTLYNTIHDLQKANKQLKERIEKSIEYIENDLQSFLYSIEYKKLLELLKGDEQ